jgi:hypothetical protein
MAQLTDGQKAALRYALDEVVLRFQNRPAPPLERLESVANEAIQVYIARARSRGETVDYVRVRISHDGCGNFAMTPIVFTLIHSITITGQVAGG